MILTSHLFLVEAAVITVAVIVSSGCCMGIQRPSDELDMIPELSKRTDSSEIIEPWRPYYMAHACEWTFLSIACHPQRVINVVRATYGRIDTTYCPHLQSTSSSNRPCPGSSSSAVNIVSRLCNGNSSCTIPAYRGLFGDPCPDTFEYLEVYYACVAEGPRTE